MMIQIWKLKPAYNQIQNVGLISKWLQQRFEPHVSTEYKSATTKIFMHFSFFFFYKLYYQHIKLIEKNQQ